MHAAQLNKEKKKLNEKECYSFLHYTFKPVGKK